MFQLPSLLFMNLFMFLWLPCAVCTLDWRNVQCMDPMWSIVNLNGDGHPNMWAKLVESENINDNIRREVAGHDVQQLSVCFTIFTSHSFFFMTWQPLVGQGFLIAKASQSHSNTPLLIGLLWTSDRLVAETSDNARHSQETDIHAPSGIRTLVLANEWL